jgi:Spherulation-specific family 4
MATEPSGILVPAYVDPMSGAWQPVLDVASAMMLGGLIVVANDGNGPGYNENTHTYNPPSQDYRNVIDALHRQCALVVGYVYDCWANTNPPNTPNCPRSHEITADIDRWFNIYNIDGIFIDQVLDTDHPPDQDRMPGARAGRRQRRYRASGSCGVAGRRSGLTPSLPVCREIVLR